MNRATWLLVGLSAVAVTVVNYVVGGDEWSLAFLGFGVVGTFVAWKVPGHVTGPLMIGLSAVSALADSEALQDVAPATGWVSVAWALLMGLFLLTFPSGQLPRNRWRPIVLLALGVTVVGFFVVAGTGDEGPYVVVPLMAFVLGAVVDVVLRYRRSGGDQKAQMKLVVFATIASAVLLVLPGLAGVPDRWYDIIVVAGFTLVPLAVGGAILRYRLYDIDRIISRTLTYATVVGLLAAAYVGLVWIITSLLQTQGSLAVAASTLAVAALFNPLRRRVLHLVDRRFNRSRYEAEKVLREFEAGLQDTRDTHGLTLETLTVVERTLQPASIGLWLKEP